MLERDRVCKLNSEASLSLTCFPSLSHSLPHLRPSSSASPPPFVILPTIDDRKEKDDDACRNDGEENQWSTADSRYSSLPSRDDRKRWQTCPAYRYSLANRSLAAHFISRIATRAGRKRPIDRLHRIEGKDNDDRGSRRGGTEVVASTLAVSERERWCVACRTFMCAVR